MHRRLLKGRAAERKIDWEAKLQTFKKKIMRRLKTTEGKIKKGKKEWKKKSNRPYAKIHKDFRH